MPLFVLPIERAPDETRMRRRRQCRLPRMHSEREILICRPIIRIISTPSSHNHQCKSPPTHMIEHTMPRSTGIQTVFMATRSLNHAQCIPLQLHFISIRKHLHHHSQSVESPDQSKSFVRLYGSGITSQCQPPRPTAFVTTPWRPTRTDLVRLFPVTSTLVWRGSTDRPSPPSSPEWWWCSIADRWRSNPAAVVVS